MRGRGGLRRREVIRRGLGLGVAALGLDAFAACAPPGNSVPSAGGVLPPPETTSLRLAFAVCDAPYWMADDVLRQEGFSGMSAVSRPAPLLDVVKGDADIGVVFANTFAGFIDAGQPVVALAGIHPGCAELWVGPGISTISDLKGKTVAVNAKTFTFDGKTSPDTVYSFFASILAYVGIDPGAVNFVEIGPNASRLDAFLAGASDAFLARAEEGALLRANAKTPGKVILDTTMDKPWSQLVCCFLLANRTWVNRNPVAAKRATRAFLRATDLTAKDRRAAARVAIERGIFGATPAVTEEVIYDTIKDLPYDWREYDPEETVRFYALRLNDAKLIRRTPQQIITEGTNFEYFRQLRKELKA